MKSYSIINDSSLSTSRGDGSLKHDFRCYTPKWTMEEVVMRDEVRDSLNDVISFCKNREIIVNQWHFNHFLKDNGAICINLYGEPGTGKTIAANAVVHAIGLKAVEVSLAEILGDLQGQTEKNLSSLFQFADNNNCVIIFNDADSLLSKRESGGANSTSGNIHKDHLLNLLDTSRSVIIFTTNFMENYDDAFKSRMLFNIGIPLPNYQERLLIWKFHIDKSMPRTASYEELASVTEGLSGRNIRQIALTMGIRLTSNRLSSITKDAVEIERNKILCSKNNTVETVAKENIPNEVLNKLNS